MKKILSSPFLAALIGGAIVAAVMLIAGIGDTTSETIVEQSSVRCGCGEQWRLDATHDLSA